MCAVELRLRRVSDGQAKLSGKPLRWLGLHECGAATSTRSGFSSNEWKIKPAIQELTQVPAKTATNDYHWAEYSQTDISPEEKKEMIQAA